MGLIFDIKRYAINDGPGIRITIFHKGCPLNCVWCHNPESISPKKQKLYTQKKCISCKICVDACPEKALSLTEEGIVTNTDLCTLCGICANECPTKAIEMSGQEETVPKLLAEIKKEVLVMDQSGGGVTFSGGEPLMQAEFLLEMLKACGQLGIHRVVDTSGYASKETLSKVAKETDLFLYDLKHMNSELHKQWTGVPNIPILENLKFLSDLNKEIIIRVPFIKGVNSDCDNIHQLGQFLAGLKNPVQKVELLAYHSIAEMKYQKMGQKYNDNQMSEPSEEELKLAIDILHSHQLRAEIG